MAAPTRRQVLLGAGAGAGLVVLTACSSGGAPSGARTTAPPIPPGTDLAAVADVPVGGGLAVTVGKAPVLVSQPAEGELLAFDATCTHERCPVEVDDDEFRCPCHQSRYDLATGEVLGGPAPRPLTPIPVVVQDGRVVTT